MGKGRFGTIIQIGDILVSEDVVMEYFACDYAVCRGACCIVGDSGAPLAEAEIEGLERDYPAYNGFMTDAGRAAVDAKGFFEVDRDDDIVTPLMPPLPDSQDCPCAFCHFGDAGECLCAIEMAGRVKPISCSLYPIRVTNIGVSLALLPLIPAVTGNLSWAFALDVFRNLVVIMVLPCVAALILRKFRPEATAWPKKFKMLSLSIWSVLLFIVSAGAMKFLRTHSDVSPVAVVEIAGIAALVCAVNFTLGYWIVPRDLRREGSQTLGQKNTMLTLYLAMTFASPLAALGPTFYVICHNTWNACQLFLYDRKQKKLAEQR